MKRLPCLRALFVAAPLAIAVTAAGCAVMQIDVDVYKGPLANHPETQLRQFASYAIGVKHLLVSLRNEAEWPRPAERQLRTVGLKFAYEPREHLFQDESAKLLNAVLSMYTDLGNPDLAPYVAKLNETQRALELSQRTFRYDGVVDAELCESFARLRRANEPLADEYFKFLQCTPAARKRPRDVVDLLKKCETRKAENPQLARLDCGGAEERTNTNAAFAALSDVGRVRAHFEYLVPFDARVRERLVTRVTNVAKAFGESRRHLETLWQLAVDALTNAHSPAFYQRTGADAEFQQWLRTLLAPSLAVLTQPRNLACALRVLPNQAGPASRLREILRRYDRGDVFGTNTAWTGADYDAATRTLESAIRAEGGTLAPALRDVHERFRAVNDAVILSQCKGFRDLARSIAPPESRRFGIVRGGLDADISSTIEQVLENVQVVVQQAGAQGFDAGRLTEGIETLTQRFLDAANTNASTYANVSAGKAAKERKRNAAAVSEAARRLEDALIAFSQKILTVANHRALFRESRSVGGHDASANETGEHPGYRPSAARASSETAIRRDVLLLQAVGNTLISFADELRFRSDHERHLRDRGPSERAAQERAFAMGSAQAFELLRNELRARGTRLREEATKLAKDIERLEQNPSSGAGGTDLEARKKMLAAEKSIIEGFKREVESAAAAYMVMSGNVHPDFMHLVDDLAARKLKEIAPRLRQDAVAKGAKAKPEEFTGFVKTAVTVENPLGTANDKLKHILEQATAYLGAAAVPKPNVKTPTAGVLYERLQQDAFGTVEAKRPNWSQRAASASKLDAEIANLAKGPDTARDKVAALKRQQVATAADAMLLESAHTTIAGLRDELFKTLGIAGTDIGYEGMVNALRRLLGADKDKKEYVDALNALTKVGTPAAAGLLAPGPAGLTPEDQKTALDNVIALLGNELIAANRAGLTDQVKNLKEAIAVAHQRRADMTLIRPASAYLRNSNAATSFQSDPQVFWRNMLGDHGKRAFLPAGLTRSDEERELNYVKTEIDKQFWQTVNTVRVAGGGKTNYVIAKDDIGNWYVKAYETDPSSIISAARSLAMFNLGGRFDLNLVRDAEIGQALNDPDLSDTRRQQLTEERTALRQSSTGNVDSLDRVLRDYRAKYVSTMRDDAAALAIYAGKVEVDMRAAWSTAVPSASEDTLTRLQAIATKHAGIHLKDVQTQLSSAELDKQTPAQVSRTMLGVMNDLRRFAVNVEQEIANDPEWTKPASGEAAKAATSMTEARLALEARTGRVRTLENEVAQAQALYDQSSVEARANQLNNLNTLKSSLNEARAAQTRAEQDLEKARAAEKKAQAEVESVRASRSTLAKAGRERVFAQVRSVADRRLVEIERYNQAIIVVKGAASPPPNPRN